MRRWPPTRRSNHERPCVYFGSCEAGGGSIRPPWPWVALDDAILKDIGVCRCEIDWIAREQFADRPRARDEEQVVLSAWIAGRKPAAGSMIVEPGIDRCSAGLP